MSEIDENLFDESAAVEDLVRSAGELPQLTSRFRKRVLTAAFRAQSRREARRRRTGWAALLLVGLLGLSSLRSGSGPVEAPVASAAPAAGQLAVASEPVPASLEGPMAFVGGAEIGHWSHVEAVLQFRRVQLHALRGTL